MPNRFRWPAALVLLSAALLPLSVAAAQAPASWSQVGTASIGDLAVNAAGVIWAVQFDRISSVDKPVLKWNGSEFIAQPSTAVRIAVDPQGNPWTVSSTGVLANLPTGASQWTVASIKAADVAVGANGSVWAIGTDQSIRRLTNGAWQKVSGAAVRISVDPRGNAWVVNGGGAIWRFDGTAFQYVAGSAQDISVGADGSVFIVGTKSVTGGFEILQWNGNGWTPVPGAGGVVVAAGQKLYIGRHEPGITRVYTTDYVRANPATSTGVVSISIPVYTQPSSPTTSQPSSPPSSQPTTILIQGQPIDIVGVAVKDSAALAGNETQLVIRGGPTTVNALPIPGTLICPIITGQPMKVVKGCALVGEPAVFLAKAPSTTCANGEFNDPQNGGECWTCPASYVRNASPVSSKDACWKPIGENLSKATNVGKLGCKSGFFNDPIYGCYQCPAGFNRTLDNVTWKTACSQSIVGPFSFATSGGKPTLACAAPSFGDPIDGGTCWTCPANYRRTLNPVNGNNACAQTYETQYSVATQKSGCSTVASRVGYGTPFRDARNGGECWACPIPLLRAVGSAVNSTDRGPFGACNAGGNTNRLVWQSPQYPAAGAYAYMPGLLEMAFSNPKIVDAFVTKRALGDPNKKRAIWASMVADPGSSPEVKALLFSALLTAARQPNPSADARTSLAAFENYARARRIFIAQEATRMFDEWQGVDSYNATQATRNSMGIGSMKSISADVMGEAGADFKMYAWSAASPDSAGLEFVIAAGSLADVPQSAAGPNLNSYDPPTMAYLGVVFMSLDKGIEKLGDQGVEMMKGATSFSKLASGRMVQLGAAGAGLALSLVEAGVEFGRALTTMIEKEKKQEEYDKLVAEASKPLSVKELLESKNEADPRSLLLYWALATSPYSPNAKLGEGRIVSPSLCQTDEWTRLQCSQAKTTILKAATIAAATMSTGN